MTSLGPGNAARGPDTMAPVPSSRPAGTDDPERAETARPQDSGLRRRLARGRPRAKAVAHHLLPEVLVVHVGVTGGGRELAAVEPEDAGDVGPLELLDDPRLGLPEWQGQVDDRPVRSGRCQERGDVGDHVLARHDDRALHDVLELAHVARPGIADQSVEGGRREATHRLLAAPGALAPGSGPPARECPRPARGGAAPSGGTRRADRTDRGETRRAPPPREDRGWSSR